MRWLRRLALFCSRIYFVFPWPVFSAGLTRLSEESLTRPPEEVFDILSKLGEG
ncbi:serine/threonine-protein kinase 3, partial [Elysia marginata]